MLIGIFGVAIGTTLFTSTLLAGMTGVLTGTALFIALIIARMLHATVMAASMPAANAYMADITDAQNRTKGMGAAGAANNLGSILGPAIAGLAFISLLAPLWIMAAVAFLNALFVWRFLPEPPRHRAPMQPKRLKYSDPRILPFVIVGVLMFTGMGMVQQTIGFRMQDVLALSAADTAQTVGVAMMLSAACSLLAQAVIVQRLTIAPFNLLRLAMPLLIVAFVLMATTTSQLSLTLAMGVLGPGHGSGRAGFHGRRLAGRAAGRARRGCRGCRFLWPAWLHHRSACWRSALPDCAATALRADRRHVRCPVSRHVLARRQGYPAPGLSNAALPAIVL